jgi:uncharacterized surface protein with fasciclin (FAS1) repeats
MKISRSAHSFFATRHSQLAIFTGEEMKQHKLNPIALSLSLLLFLTGCTVQVDPLPSTAEESTTPAATPQEAESTIQPTFTATAPVTTTTPVTAAATALPAVELTATVAPTTVAPITVAPTAVVPATPAAATSVSPTQPATATQAVTATPGVTATGDLTGAAAAAPGAGLTATTPLTGPDPLADTSGQTIGAIIQSVGDFSVLATAIQGAGMAAALTEPGPYTLFAPTDEAFAVLPPVIRDALLNDTALLTALLRYHLVADQATTARLAELGGAQAISNQPLTVTVATSGELLINDAAIVRGDVPAANGVIHVINRILTPPDLPLVIPPAPTAAIGLATDPAQVQSFAQLADADTSGQTIVEILGSTAGLAVAAAAIDSAGLTDALQQAGPYTLFVPTDAAFNQLPGTSLEALLNDTTALAGVLQYHLVLDQVAAAELAGLPVVLTTNGQELTVTVGADGQLLINNAPVEQADIEAANGVIHIIGAILTPPAQ